MTTENKQREIPPIPGGGSWTFDEPTWSWISNDPVLVAAPALATDPAPVHNEFHAEE